MRARINVGIRSNGNPRFLSRVARNTVNQLQLRTGLHIEEENIGVKRISNFTGRFADTRKDYFFGRTARAQDSEQFTARDNVETCSPLGESPKDIDVRIGFDGVTNQVRYGSESLIEDANMPFECPFAIDIYGCTHIGGNPRKRNFFAIQLAGLVLEVMHAAL